MIRILQLRRCGMYLFRFGYEKCVPNKRTVRLIYSCNVVHYVVNGQGFFNGIKLGSGSGFVCRTGDAVEYRPNPSDPWEYYWIRMTGDDCEQFFSSVNADERHIFRHDLNSKLKTFFELVNEMGSPEYESLRYSAFPKIALSLHQPDNIQERTSGERYVELAKQMIDDSLSENILINDIANRLHLNRCYLRNIFFEHEGISPCSYKQNRRMEQASQLLRQSDYSISIIAGSVGYKNPLQFSREFKKHFSLSPTEYRDSFKAVPHSSRFTP